ALTRRAIPLMALGIALALAAGPAQTFGADDAPTAAPVASAERCVPLGGLLVGQTIRRELRNGGDEVTERLGQGVYRVTRCDRAGAITSSMTVEPVPDPDGRLVLGPAAIVRGHGLLTID